MNKRIIRQILNATKFEIFANYMDTIRGEGYISSSLIGDPHKFLGQGVLDRSGIDMMIGVGGDGSHAFYNLSFDMSEYPIKNHKSCFAIDVYENVECAITHEVCACYRYRLELIEKSWNKYGLFTPAINLGASVMYNGEVYCVGGVQAPSLHARSRLYSVGGKRVGAKDLSILTVDNTYVPITDYIKGIAGLPEPATSDEGVPMMFWDVLWIDPVYHRYGTRESQTIPAFVYR